MLSHNAFYLTDKLKMYLLNYIIFIISFSSSFSTTYKSFIEIDMKIQEKENIKPPDPQLSRNYLLEKINLRE